MPFDTFNDRLKLVAKCSLATCRSEWGGNGLRTEKPIDPKIGWTPSFFLRPNRYLIVGVEVSDVIYPGILKIAAHDIENHHFPISIYQACALDVYQSDPKMARVSSLRADGFGIITVDDNGVTAIQVRAEPIAQHISTAQLESELRELSLRLKVKFRAAYATYATNIGQGLQEAGQIVEALISSLAKQAEAAGAVPAGTTGKSTAGIIDELYPTGTFHNYRATLGGARSFANKYRNVASHAPKNAKEAADKIRKCKGGFLDALRIAADLKYVHQDLGYKILII